MRAGSSEVLKPQETALNSGKSLKGQGKRQISEDFIRNFLLSAGASFALAMVFFRNPLYIIITFPVGIIIYRQTDISCRQQEKRKQRSQCKDALLGVSSAIRAGYAIENAIPQGTKSLRRVWGDECPAVKAWEKMEHGINLNIPVEKVFAEYARESGLREMETLAGLLGTAKRSAGSVGNLFKEAGSQLEQSLFTESEIQTKLTEKKMELYIMLFMPPGILVYLQLFSYDIIHSLYEEVWGNVFMTCCLFVYISGWLIGMKLINVEV